MVGPTVIDIIKTLRVGSTIIGVTVFITACTEYDGMNTFNGYEKRKVYFFHCRHSYMEADQIQ